MCLRILIVRSSVPLAKQEIRQVGVHIQHVERLMRFGKPNPKIRLPSPNERSILFQAGQQDFIRHTVYIFEPFDGYWGFPSKEAWEICEEAGKFGRG